MNEVLIGLYSSEKGKPREIDEMSFLSKPDIREPERN
jgi:hypothetical protein